MPKTHKILDANEAVADVAYRLSEVVAIYPITPSSAMGEWADQWASEGRKNLWGDVPSVMEMQSEGGAAGAIHGALQTGSLATTFTASQGLLLMIPNMYKIAGELTPAVFHIAARSLATHALSIFGDHGDVMAARASGWAMLCSNSVQEASDLALVAHAATLETRVPFMHFFDGFRTSHEINKIQTLPDETVRAMIDEALIEAHRGRGLTPDRPVLRGTAQNPDVFFQSREAANSFYAAVPAIVQKTMDKLAKLTGRSYKVYEYHGAPDAERVAIVMGSGAETLHATVDALNASGAKVGVLKVRLYRPFDAALLCAALPASVKSVAVLDRTKEPGSAGEPLFLDAVASFQRGGRAGLRVIGGIYGLSSKEFTPAMAKAVFDELSKASPKPRFTVGIEDDVTYLSLKHDPDWSIEGDEVVRAVFYGLGSDGTVGANKNTIHIIGDHTDSFVQAYFVYDSKKSGAMTVSHLRFGPEQIRAPYLIEKTNFLGCHQTSFVGRYKMLRMIAPGGVFLLNTAAGPLAAWETLPKEDQEEIRAKKLRFFVIDAYKVARDNGLGGRINTVMQACFFSISGVLPKERAVEAIRESIREAYGKKSEELVNKNLKAVEESLKNLHQVVVPAGGHAHASLVPPVAPGAPDWVRSVLGPICAGEGDRLPVSAMPVDGTYPTATAQWEKRGLAQEVPVWDESVCIQCAKCVIVCPHAVIRPKVYMPAELAGAPPTFKSCDPKDREWKGMKYTLQVSVEDCTGCGICVDVCPARNKSETKLKAINMRPAAPLVEAERKNWEFFLELPEVDRRLLKGGSIRHEQFQRPLFEFSGACAGCGETPYLKLLSQLYGDRLLIANATGCSSIYGGNLPTTPWAKNEEGRGPAWANSLFEDNAEFGLGMRLSEDHQTGAARDLLKSLENVVGAELARSILDASQKDEADIYDQRERVAELKKKLAGLKDDKARRLLALSDHLTRKSVWIVGGDGWAYDIGYGGLDHVLASGKNVKVLVLDTEVYSNTGGQKSKSTPRGAVAKFSSGGNPAAKKDLGLMAMSYGNIYVASVAMGARDEQTLKTFIEAEAYDGPALIIAYSHCIAHGIDMRTANQNQKAAADTGKLILYRYSPDRAKAGEAPLILDSKPTRPNGLGAYLASENRFQMLAKSKPEEAKVLFDMAQQDAATRWELYEYLAGRKPRPAI
ncbi:MAG: pyruvate:ferredoxin (flavodoxin) oxidoreductase [Elusimicrobiota bacterium]|nr:pyruvate:ferredoxin (flavodoxin) oxidoreductase [Elusimicrobiota bacterium]